MTAAGRRAVRNPETALAHNVKTKRNTGTQWVACMGAQLLGGGGREGEVGARRRTMARFDNFCMYAYYKIV